MPLLQEYIEFKNGKKRPEDKGTYPVYGGNGILDYTDNFNSEGGIVIGRVGVYCGSVYLPSGKYWVSDNAISGKVKENTDLRFAYYLLKNLHLNERRIGTSQPLLTQEILNSIEVDIPSKEIQKKIGRVLELLDKKILQNEQINDNLEQQASILYKHLFPYVLSDELPDGWDIGTLGEIIEIHDSKRIPLSGAERAKMKKIYPYYGAASLMDYVDDYIFEGKYLLLGEDGTVIDDFGYPILQYVWGKFWVNNHAHILTGKSGFNVESLYMLLKQTSVKAIVTGAVQAKISQANLRSIPILIPPSDMLKDYNRQIAPIFDMFRANETENKLLLEIRDVLLPKLMSGEIDVSEIQL